MIMAETVAAEKRKAVRYVRAVVYVSDVIVPDTRNADAVMGPEKSTVITVMTDMIRILVPAAEMDYVTVVRVQVYLKIRPVMSVTETGNVKSAAA